MSVRSGAGSVNQESVNLYHVGGERLLGAVARVMSRGDIPCDTSQCEAARGIIIAFGIFVIVTAWIAYLRVAISIYLPCNSPPSVPPYVS